MIKAFKKVAAMAHFPRLEPTKTNKLQAFHVIKRCTLSSIYPLQHTLINVVPNATHSPIKGDQGLFER